MKGYPNTSGIEINRICVLLFIFCISITCGSPLRAQTLSLDSCINMALSNSRQIEKSKLQTRQSEYTVSAMKANFYPNLKLSATDLYSTSNGFTSIGGGYLPTFTPGADGSLQPNVLLDPATGQPVMSADGQTPVFQQYAYFPEQKLDFKVGNVIMAGVTAEQPIYMGGKIVAGYKMSKLARDMAVQNERLTEAQVIVATEEAYALLVHATEMQRVAVVYDSLLLRLKYDVDAAKAQGMASHNDVLKVGVKKDEAQLKLRQAENAVRLAQMNLGRLIGDTNSKPLPLVEEGYDTAADIEIEPSWSLSQRPEAVILNMKSRLAEQNVRLKRSDFLPHIGVSVGYHYLYGMKFNDQRLFNGGSFGAILNVSIPIFHFGEGRNKIRAARMEARQARVEEQDLLEQMQLEAMREANNLDEARLELEMTGRALSQAEENLRIARKSYNAGMESLSDLLEAQTLYQQALARRADARFQLSLSLARYRKATGRQLR